MESSANDSVKIPPSEKTVILLYNQAGETKRNCVMRIILPLRSHMAVVLTICASVISTEVAPSKVRMPAAKTTLAER